MAKLKNKKPLDAQKTASPKNKGAKGANTNTDEVPEIVIDYDGLWKVIIEEFFWEFIAFFLPKLYADIDTSYPPEFLDKELMAIHKELKIPKQIADKLIKVRLKNGNFNWILIHVEVQGKFEIDFSMRMFLYKAFIFAKHRLPIVGLAIYPTAKTPKKFDYYDESYYDTTLMYRFNAYKVAKQKEADLIKSNNIFALFVLANLYVIKTTPKLYDKRAAFKENLFELAQTKNIPKERIDKMLIFVNEIIALPIDLQTTFMENVLVKKSGRKRLPIEDKLEQSRKEFFKAFFTAEMGVTPEVYFAQQKAAMDAAQAAAQAAEQAAAQAAAQAAEKEANELIHQIYITIQMRRQLDLDVNKAALVMNMPVDEITFIFRYEPQKNMTAEWFLPIFKKYLAAKRANPAINPMTWESTESQ